MVSGWAHLTGLPHLRWRALCVSSFPAACFPIRMLTPCCMMGQSALDRPRRAGLVQFRLDVEELVLGPMPSKPLASTQVNGIIKTRDDEWRIATMGGLWRFDGNSLEQQTLAQSDQGTDARVLLETRHGGGYWPVPRQACWRKPKVATWSGSSRSVANTI